MRVWFIEWSSDDSEGTGRERLWFATKAEAERRAREIDKDRIERNDGAYVGVDIASTSVPPLRRELVAFLNSYAGNA